tara:strand:+ start:233 stop:1417 length:1185 start_codon:yes stop_codon:yes gene_type:complete
MQNFIAQSMRRMGLAPSNKVTPTTPNAAGAGVGGKAPLAHMEVSSKWSYSTLEYPMDIQSRTDMGHYMMFYVNVAENTGYSRYNSTEKAKKTGTGRMGNKKSVEIGQKQTASQNAILEGQAFSKKQQGSAPDDTGDSWKPGFKPKVVERKSHQGTSSELMGIKRTMRTNDAIILYMPAQVLTNYTAQYKDSELGANFGEAAARISRADVSTVGGMTELVKGFAAQGADAMERAGAAMIGGLTGSDLMAARDKLSNRAQNNFLEATFTGLGFRKFSFSWKFTPKSPEEMIQVEKIIKTFKFHMLPEIPNDNRFGRYYTTPAEFDLFYMFRGDENSWINKIHTCILLNMEVNYAPNGYQTFRPIQGRNGAPPSEIDMKLDFQETKLITKADVEEGF